ncbi:MAG: AbrB/MazE/SpoVT family DNA-binding domain-containing protein [Chloroflexi bacterium]|nr:AbrB/MazE/SpoVT family DNA-binding domain-containing protein [Chloroflexota bacterium]
MVVSRIGRRGQVTIPKLVRDWLGIEEGDHIVFLRHGESIVLQAMNKTLLDLRGTVPVGGPQDFELIRREVREQLAHKVSAGER